ncbi:MAG: CpsD/CapB family tyrosine-protein kinase [Coriobacteriia bacterium]|nr:CpsD/CapB family tyrosine-protein kinase [Coriobacteriia bacterium]
MFGKSKKVKNLRPMLEVCQSDAMRNAAGSLLANIEYSSVDRKIQAVVVTSAAPNEGKSTISLSLAMAMGTKGKKCLLVETDLRRRSLCAVLKAHPRHGLHAVLRGDAKLAETVVETEFKNLFFLDAEPGIPNPEEILSSLRFAELLDALRKEYDFIILDTTPVGAFPDALLASRVADGTIMVIREGSTDKRAAMLAVDQLRNSGAHLLGTAVNFQTKASGGSYGYYGYYYEEKQVPADSPEVQEILDGKE